MKKQLLKEFNKLRIKFGCSKANFNRHLRKYLKKGGYSTIYGG